MGFIHEVGIGFAVVLFSYGKVVGHLATFRDTNVFGKACVKRKDKAVAGNAAFGVKGTFLPVCMHTGICAGDEI